MKFSTTLVAVLFGITAQGLAVPAISERATSPVAVLQADIASLQAAVAADLGAITTAIQKSAGDTSAQVTATINADLGDIVNQILVATNAVITATTGAATALNPVDVNTLIAVLQSFQALVANIQTTIQNGTKNLPAQTQAAIAAEIKAVQNALAALQAPLVTYAGQVQTAITTTGATDPGIGALVGSILVAVNSLLTNLGLGGSAVHL